MKEKLTYHSIDLETLTSELKSNLESGLTEKEAQIRLEKYGPNLQEKRKQKSILKIIIEQFTSPIVWLLIGAGSLAFAFGEVPEGVAIVIVIVINASIGFVMEWQAVRSMHNLLKMGRAHSKVIRDGKTKEIDSSRLVPGDLIYLEAGDLVTADARLTKQHNLAVKEAALTGESTQVSKEVTKLPEDTVLADRVNCVFKGTVITRGNAKGLVTATGNQTELGHITGLAQEAGSEVTPLDKKLNRLSRKLLWLTLVITLFIFLSGVWRGRDWLIMIETAIALAVAAIPEGLPVIATITLARGMVTLSKKNAIVKSLKAVQTLGETNVIFTDKTGTLTENEMYLDRIVIDRETISLRDEEQNINDPEKNKALIERLLRTGILCNDSSYDPEDESTTGDPIEIAILKIAVERDLQPDQIRKDYPQVKEIPFEAEIQMMGTVNQVDGEYLINVKGAPEAVIPKCTHLLDKNQEVVDFTDRDKWHQLMDELAANGFRVLCFAFRESAEEPADDFIHDLVFLGLGCFIDPPRDEVREAVESCLKAGIKVIMVTGDHPETAGYIAENVGLVKNREEAVKTHGRDLPDKMLADKDHQNLLDTHIFARTNPSQKLDLVDLYQKHNYVVGMTGDGVNDAPALKKADIGIAMGERGTEAAKEVSDIVLKDDAFSSIVLAIRQGRTIFRNIRLFVVYLLSCNLSEILVVGIASFLGIPLPLLTLQILFLNMVTDVFPALALGMSEGDEDIMTKPPRTTDEPIIPTRLWVSLLSYGMAMTIAVLGIEFYALYYMDLPDMKINNMTFYTLILVQLWNVFNLPERQASFFKNEVTKNKYIWMAILISISIVVISWFIIPVREALSLTSLNLEQWGLVAAFSLIPVILVQLFKRAFRVIV
ncbi:MAG: cation-transporting P-type ATPase [Saprospiraceae bacterium]|nr:cation-transporting P-type ATPase [Saprospiraceae bacterium]